LLIWFEKLSIVSTVCGVLWLFLLRHSFVFSILYSSNAFWIMAKVTVTFLDTNFCTSKVSSFNQSIYKFGLSVCLFVCFFVCLFVSNKRQNGWTDRAQIFVGYLETLGKVYEWSKFQIFVSIKIRSSLNFWKYWKSTKFFVKIRKLFLFCFTMYTKRTCSQLI